jgi:hypothetical protein
LERTVETAELRENMDSKKQANRGKVLASSLEEIPKNKEW